ncbi:MAG: ATP-grasp domain-containing protein [Bryobacteraceae bacterium]
MLILGADTRAFLAVVRSLGRHGLEVHVAWCPWNSPSLRSRYVRKIQVLPEYRHEDTAWIRSLVELLRRERYDLVVACNDSCILPLQRHRAEIEPAGRLDLLPDDVFEICFDKEKTSDLAQRLGVPVPRQRLIHSDTELETLGGEWGYPLVLKPRASVSLRDPFSKRYVAKIWAPADIGPALREFELSRGVLVQENFIGKGVGVEVLARNGETLTAFQHERVHEPLLGGGSSYRKSVPLDPALLEATRRLMRALGYTGVAMVEFKRNQRTGAWVLMEINSRFWGSLPLSIAAGIDFPRYLYEMICTGRTEFPKAYREGLYLRNWLMDLYWLKANLKADRSNPALMTLPLREVAREIFHLLLLRERSDTLVLDDPAPAFSEIWRFLRERCTARLRRIPLVRGEMRREAQRAIARARRVLFLCRGNICRSPFAERALQLAARGAVECASAGSYPVAGRRSPDAAIEAARRLGVDLGSHRSRVLERALADSADVILIFDREQQSALEAWYPEALDKVHYLGALDPTGPLEIGDPYGCELDGFLASYRRLQHLLALAVFQRSAE